MSRLVDPFTETREGFFPPLMSKEPDAGAIAHRIRREFRDLKRLEGFEEARATVAEIINLEAERKAR